MCTPGCWSVLQSTQQRWNPEPERFHHILAASLRRGMGIMLPNCSEYRRRGPSPLDNRRRRFGLRRALTQTLPNPLF